MTLQQPRTAQSTRAETPTIDELVSRHARFVTESLDITLHADNEYRLDAAIGTIGFVGRAGNRFFALVGSRRDAVTNAGESLSFDTCVAWVVNSYRNEASCR